MAQDHTPKRKTAAEILATKDTSPEDIYVPEWDTTLTIVPLTKKQQLDIRKAAVVDGDIDQELVQRGMWREGVTDPRFSEDEMTAVFEKNAGAVDRVLKRLLALSDGDATDAAKGVAKAEAAFPKGQ